MAGLKCEVTFPRRQALLKIPDRAALRKNEGFGFYPEYHAAACVPVLVWPMLTTEGLFVVERQDGTVQMVQPDSLTFLDGKELFDQCDWSE